MTKLEALTILVGSRAAHRLIRASHAQAQPTVQDERPEYRVRTVRMLDAARAFVSAELMEEARQRDALRSPQAVRDFLRIKIGHLDVEAFWLVYLDAQNRVITAGEAFRGTLTQTSVYPREVVKAALQHNCAAMILAHNHPSGLAEPSEADKILTQALKQALALVDVRVLDHFVVGQGAMVSFAERGLL